MLSQYIEVNGRSGYAFELLATTPATYKFKRWAPDVTRYPRHHLFGVHNLETVMLADYHNCELLSSTVYQPERMIHTEIRRTFFDFYALEYLVSLTKDTILSHSVQVRLEQLFNEATHKLSLGLLDALDRATRREIRHLSDNFTMCRYKGGSLDYTHQLYRKYANHPANISWEDMHKFFSYVDPMKLRNARLDEEHPAYDPDGDDDYNGWDEDYGGTPWANGVVAMQKLKKCILAPGNPRELIAHIDHIFDLQHNSGNLLNKTEFRCINIRILDYRFHAKSVFDLVVAASPSTRNIYNRILRHIERCKPAPTAPVFGLQLDKDVFLLPVAAIPELLSTKVRSKSGMRKLVGKRAHTVSKFRYPNLVNVDGNTALKRRLRSAQMKFVHKASIFKSYA